MNDVEPEMVTLVNETNIIQPCIVGTYRKRKMKPYPISELKDLRVQEAMIIQDLLFNFLGYEGFYIRYSEKYNPSITDSAIRGPDFKVAKHLDVSVKSITKKLVKYGKYYSGLKRFLEVYDHQNFGKILQKLCYLISEFLDNYHQVILGIENEFKFNSMFNLNTLENILNQKVSKQISHLYEISMLIHNESCERSRLKDHELPFEEFLNNIRSTLKTTGAIDAVINNESFKYFKGGLVLRAVQNRINSYKGDSVSYEILTMLYESLSKDYVDMLNKWLINGEIDDSFDEFLIKKKEVPNKYQALFSSKSEHYWNELFMVRADGLIDQLQSQDIQMKVLNTGKYLNIFKICTGMENFEGLNEHLAPIDSLTSQDLGLKINGFYDRANKLLLKLIFEGYNFANVLDKYQTIFLFKDAFKVDIFLDLAFNDLKRNRFAISITRLQKLYQEVFQQQSDLNKSITSISDIINHKQNFSISSVNFYDIAKEIMNVQSFDTDNVLENDPNFKTFLNKTFEKKTHITSSQKNNNLFDHNQSDEYTVASVDLTVDLPFPLNILINRESSYHYELMYKLQMMVKFIGKYNDLAWKEINNSYVWRYRNYPPEIKKWILRCRILHNRMRDFFGELQFYLNYDVIESNYNKLRKSIIQTQVELKSKELGSNSNVSNGNEIFSKPNTLPNYSNSNNLFNDRMYNRKVSRSNSPEPLIDVNSLMLKMNEFLNTIVNDALMTKPDLISVLKRMFDVILLYDHYLMRLKKGLILCDENLFSTFSRDYPLKFNTQSMDTNLILERFENLKSSLGLHYEIFNDSLTEFIVTLKSYGETENKHILILTERLERCFPEK